MNEQEREIVIKEARLAALHDIEMALIKLESDRSVDAEIARTAKFIRHYINQRMGDVGQDKADRMRLSHTLWGE